MHGATYRPALETNAVMAGGAVAEVVESKAPGLAAGDLVFGDTGWQDYALALLRRLSGCEVAKRLICHGRASKVFTTWGKGGWLRGR